MASQGWIGPEAIIDLAVKILKGLEYIHSFGDEKLIHRDLKPDNIFVRAIPLSAESNDDKAKVLSNNQVKYRYDVKLGDLGQIRNTGGPGSETNRGAQGTLPYMAYEVFIEYVKGLGTYTPFDPKVYTQSTDIFAIALSICYLITKNVPFMRSDMTQSKLKVPCLPEYFPEELRNFLSKMLHIEADKRPKAKIARCHFELLQEDEDFMKKFEYACRIFRNDRENFKNKDYPREKLGPINYEYKSIDEALLSSSSEFLKKELNSESNSEYTGQAKQGQPNGWGTMTFQSGKIKEGIWQHGKFSYGKTIFPSGNVHEGHYLDDKRHGEGLFTYSSGCVYKGSYEKDYRNGIGTFLWEDGESYVGSWMKDKRHGQGKRTYNDGTVKEGQWHMGDFV